MEFPWKAPVPGDLRDLGGGGTSFTQAAIEWFVARWARGFTIPPTSPLGTLLDAMTRVERGEAGASLESAAAVHAWQFRFLAARRLAWSIRVLHVGRAGELVDVHQAFIKKELSGVDRVGTWGMPLGFGTTTVAGRLLQASGGRMVINGERAAGHDIRWEPATGGVALIERKDRAYEVGANESLRSRIRWVASKVREAGEAFPRELPGARVLIVGLPGFVPMNKAKRMRARIEEALAEAFSPNRSPDEHPDYVVVEMVGARDTLTGGYDMAAFSEALDFGFERPEWTKVRLAFTRLYTEQARRSTQPWPIIWRLCT